MKKRLLLLVFSFVIFINQGFSQAYVNTVPDVSVKTLDSHTYRIYDLLDDGKIVVINFFSTSCGPYQTFAHDFQIAYENFGQNQGDVFFLGNNYNGTNYQVAQFADIYGLNMPLTSGLEGGGNASFEAFEVVAYPTVVVITPDYSIVERHVWEPTAENISNAVVNAGGTLVGLATKPSYKSNAVTVSPNPLRDVLKLNFELQKTQAIHIQITDLTGRVQVDKMVNGLQGENSLELDVENLRDGTYIVMIATESEGVYTTKIIVK